ncbi:LppP/LprE family lipoprotein [Streptomyces sp. NPDC055692]|uniref:LppP/LprE family lipoprotein n=1 Tax=Streptomyces sp. NPDC055692 TaxID=3155683 RepID=UPI0034227868
MTGLRPGTYKIAAGRVRGSKQDLYPPNLRQTVKVHEARTATVSVDYVNVIPHTTKVLDKRDVRTVGGVAGGLLTFDKPSSQAASLRTGDVIVAGRGPQTPDGLLRKVTAVRHGAGGQVRVSTKKATLHDAVPQGRIEVHEAALLPPGQAQQGSWTTGAEPVNYRQATALQGLRPMTTKAAASEDPGTTDIGGDGSFFFVRNTFGFTKEVSDGEASTECAWTTTSPILAQAMFRAQKPKLDFVAAWNGTWLSATRWTVTAAQSSGLEAGTKAAEAKCEWKWTYPKEAIKVGVVDAQIGPIPLVFTVESQMVGSFGLGGKLSLNLTQKANFTAGISYRGGKAEGIHSFRNTFSLAEPPTFELEAALKAGVRLSFKLYGVAGPYLDITPGAKAVEKDQIAVHGTAKLELRAGLYTAAGMDLEKLGFKNNAVEISDLWHQDKVLKTFTWQESAADKAAKEKETACPADSTMTAAVAEVDAGSDSQDRVVTATKCWKEWAVADWVPTFQSERVSTVVFKRSGDQLTPALTMRSTSEPAGDSKRSSQCAQVKAMSTPTGLMDFVCPSATGASARAPFRPASASVFEKWGYKPVSEVEGLKGPLRAVQVCGNCGGDGSAQRILLFYGNRYVGMVANGPSYSFPHIEAQDGSAVTASVRFAKPDDPVCCPTGETRTYHYEWHNSELQWTTTTA